MPKTSLLKLLSSCVFIGGLVVLPWFYITGGIVHSNKLWQTWVVVFWKSSHQVNFCLFLSVIKLKYIKCLVILEFVKDLFANLVSYLYSVKVWKQFFPVIRNYSYPPSPPSLFFVVDKLIIISDLQMDQCFFFIVKTSRFVIHVAFWCSCHPTVTNTLSNTSLLRSSYCGHPTNACYYKFFAKLIDWPPISYNAVAVGASYWVIQRGEGEAEWF